MTKRKYNRKAVKGAMVTEYLNENGYATPEVLAAEVGVSESYAGKWLRKWKLAKRNWETSSREQATPANTHVTVEEDTTPKQVSDGRAAELQDLISHKNMNAQIGEVFRACYRMGEASHSDELRDAKKIRFYIDAEIKRLGG